MTEKHRVLLIVDPQYDFIEGGSLPIDGAEKAMVELSNHILETEYSQVMITVDWHPYKHYSFTKNGGKWPTHCIAHSIGASIKNELLQAISDRNLNVSVYKKGDIVYKEEYSIFRNENDGKLIIDKLEFLKKKYGNDLLIDVCGLAGDVCVLNTITDLCEFGFHDNLNVLTNFSPSLDGGGKLLKFITENNISFL